jgi:hypothetical protein
VPRTAGSVVPRVVPRTAVPFGITDPVERARAELKAALAAIDEKANLPKRIGRATDRAVTRARAYNRRNPEKTVAIVVAGALAIGGLAWAAVRAYTR